MSASEGLPVVSVVVPTCGRPALLARGVQALLAQTLQAPWELLVVDDRHDHATQAQVAAWSDGRDRPRVRYLRPDAHGPAAARNAGWRAARAAVVAFTDDDTVPHADWLREGLAAMAATGLVGVGAAAVRGRVVVPAPTEITDHARMTQGLERAEFVTANCFVRRDALAAVGGFDERFRRAWREDSDLHFKLLRRYGTVPVAPRAVVLHPVRPAPWGVSLGQQANLMFDALLYKKHPQLYRLKVGRLRAPAAYYAIVGGTAGAALAALAGRPGIAAALAALALALVLRLALRRLRGTSHRPRHVAEMLVTSAAIPFLSLYWRIAGGLRFRVPFF